MADFLDLTDLNAFNQSVAASSPYGTIAQGLASWSPNTQSWSPAESAWTNFGKSFLAGYFGNQARNDAASQLSSVINVLPQLQSNPVGVAIPEGVDTSAFNILKGSSILKGAARKESKVDRIQDLLQTVLGEGIRAGKVDPTKALEVAASDDPMAAMAEIDLSPKRVPTVDSGSAITNNFPLLSNGRPSTEDRIKLLTQSFMEAGQTPSQASISARQQVEGEIKSNTKSFDEARAAREYGQRMLDLASTAKAGMSEAGQTGSKIASLYEKALSTLAPWNTPEADMQARGDATLSSIGPEIVKMSRSPGAVSDFETKLYLGAGPGTQQTPQTNAILAQKMEDIGKLNLEYADFLEAYRDQNSGSTAGAAQKWAEYRQAFPIFNESAGGIELNSNRPSWQEYFMGVAAPTAGAPTVGSSSIDDEKRAFAIDAKRRGLTKQQAIAEWNARKGISARGNRG